MTSAGARAVVLAGGTGVRVAASSRLRMSGGAPSGGVRLLLERGRVDLNVPPLSPGQSLVVMTPHAEVIVHGTSFAVEIVRALDGREGTSVSVAEGVVTVRAHHQEIRLTRGATWSSFDEAPVVMGAAPSAPAPPSVGTALQLTHEPRARERPARSPEHLAATSLALENRLFQEATGARQRGDEREAIRLIDELLRAYPDSALAPEALEQRRRAWERLRRSDGGR